MGPLRNKSVSVRLEEEAYLRLRRHSLRSGVPTSALVRALVHRWLQEQGDEEGEAIAERGGPERRRQPDLFGEGGAPWAAARTIGLLQTSSRDTGVHVHSSKSPSCSEEGVFSEVRMRGSAWVRPRGSKHGPSQCYERGAPTTFCKGGV